MIAGDHPCIVSVAVVCRGGLAIRRLPVAIALDAGKIIRCGGVAGRDRLRVLKLAGGTTIRSPTLSFGGRGRLRRPRHEVMAKDVAALCHGDVTVIREVRPQIAQAIILMVTSRPSYRERCHSGCRPYQE